MKISSRTFCQTRDSGQIFGYQLSHQGAWQTQICRWVFQQSAGSINEWPHRTTRLYNSNQVTKRSIGVTHLSFRGREFAPEFPLYP